MFLGLCLAALTLQAIAGHAVFNNEQDQHMAPHISLLRYVFSSSYAAAVMENWQSEYLQFTLFMLLTGSIWLGTWVAQSLPGRVEYNADLLSHEQSPVTWLDYVQSASFWERTLENWQSEFLAVGSMAIFAVYLRQRGSPESKPVGARHSATGAEG